VIANVDLNPLLPPTTISANQFTLLNTYALAKYAGLDFSVGKQSMWWGPGESGALLMSNNAAPFWMLQINRTIPMNIPLLSKVLGPFEFSNYFGAPAGQEFPPDPYMFGQKASFKPTENLNSDLPVMMYSAARATSLSPSAPSECVYKHQRRTGERKVLAQRSWRPPRQL